MTHILDIDCVSCSLLIDGELIPLPRNAFALFACLGLSHARPWKIDRLITSLYPEIPREEARKQLAAAQQYLWSAHPLLRDVFPDLTTAPKTIYLAPSLPNLYRIESLISRLERLVARVRSGDETFDTTRALLAAIVQGVDFLLPGFEEEWADSVRTRCEHIRRDIMLEMLKCDQGEDLATKVLTAGRGTSLTPAEPGVRQHLFGREKELIQLRELLQLHRVVMILGDGGVGKTALAAHAIDRENLSSRLSEVTRYAIDLRGVVRYESLLEAIMGVLGMRVGLSTMDDEAELPRLIRANLGDSILVIDNAETLEPRAIDFIAQLGCTQYAECTLLVTSRHTFPQLGDNIIELHPLAIPGIEEADEAEAGLVSISEMAARYPSIGLLINRRWMAKSRPYSPGMLCRMVQATRGFPLAIELAANRESFVARLDDPTAAPVDPVDAVINSLSQGAREHLFKLSLWEATIPSEVTESAHIAELKEASLLIPTGGDTYRIPITIQERCFNLFDIADTADEHLQTIQELSPSRAILVMADIQKALRQLRHQDYLSKALRLAASLVAPLCNAGRPREALELLEGFSQWSLHGTDMGELFDGRGRALLTCGKWKEALTELKKALIIWREAGARRETARCLSGIGIASRNLNDYQAAIKAQEEALSIFESIGEFSSVGRTLSNIASLYQHLNDSEAARPYLTKAIAMAREQADHGKLASDLLDLAELELLSTKTRHTVPMLIEGIKLARHQHKLRLARGVMLFCYARGDWDGLSQTIAYFTSRGVVFGLSRAFVSKIDNIELEIRPLSPNEADHVLEELAAKILSLNK